MKMRESPLAAAAMFFQITKPHPPPRVGFTGLLLAFRTAIVKIEGT
jgi:hypothetical protein